MNFLWQVTQFPKLNFTVEDVIECLEETNIIGKGCSGVVYGAELDNGKDTAVKKLWSSNPYHCFLRYLALYL